MHTEYNYGRTSARNTRQRRSSNNTSGHDRSLLSNNSGYQPYSGQPSPSQSKISAANDISRQQSPKRTHVPSVDIVILNINEKVKDLESRYIDLANFYKQSLVQEKNSSHGARRPSQNTQNSEWAEPGSQEAASENILIHELIQEKKNFNENMSTLKVALSRHEAGELSSEDQNELRRQLMTIFLTVFEEIDSTQVKSLHILSQKQNDMFQMATKSKIPSIFRNESLGLWYDAKSNIAGTIADLKTTIQKTKLKVESNLDSLASKPKKQTIVCEGHVSQELLRFKEVASQQIASIQKLQQTMFQKEQVVKEEQARTKLILEDLCDQFSKAITLDGNSDLNISGSNERSPFEKRLAEYQKASNQRNAQNRSASRGSTGHSKPASTSNWKLATCEQVLHKFANSFDSLVDAQRSRQKYALEFQKQIELNFFETQNYFARSQDTHAEPKSSQGKSSSRQSPAKASHRSKGKSSTLHDLQANNDQLFTELRKANEKYLDMRVENNKLKDKLSQYKSQLENAKSARSMTPKSASERQLVPRSAIGVKKLASTQRNSPKTVKEEVFAGQSNLNNEYTRLLAQTDLLCERVQSFMTAMRQLQRAVNKKEKDLTEQKQSFETSKSQLQEAVEVTKNDYLTVVLPEVSEFKEEPILQIQPKRALSNRSSQNTQTMPTPKANTTRAAKTASCQRKIPLMPKKENNISLVDEANTKLTQLLKQNKTLQLEKDKLKELVSELRETGSLFSKEKDDLEEKLKARSVQLQKFASQCHASSLKAYSQEMAISAYRQALGDLENCPSLLKHEECRKAVVNAKASLALKEEELATKLAEDVAKVPQNLRVDPQVSAVKLEVIALIKSKERQLFQKVDFFKANLVEKEAALTRVKHLFVEKLKELETSFVEISEEVQEADSLHQELTVKRIKAREAELMEQAQSQIKITQQIKEDASKAAIKAATVVRDSIEKSVESVLHKFESDDREQEFEALVEANQALSSQILDLKRRLEAANENPERHPNNDLQQAELTDLIDEHQQQIVTLTEELKTKSGVEATFQKEIKSLKYENKRQQLDFKDVKETFEKARSEYTNQLKAYQKKLEQQKAQIDEFQGVEERCYQIASQLKATRNECTIYEQEVERLHRALEELLEEQAFMKSLQNPAENEDEDSDEATKAKEEEEEFGERVKFNAEEAARHYQRCAEIAKKEFVILSKKNTKVQDKCETVQANLTEVQDELRSCSEENMAFQTQVADLTAENAALKDQRDKAQGQDATQQLAENAATVRKSVESEFLPRLEFKESELKQANEKLARLSQEKIQLTTRLARLEKTSADMSEENQTLSQRLAAAETELEIAMTSGDGVPAQELDTATTIGNLREANEVLEADQVRSRELNSKQIAFLASLQSAVRRRFEQQLKTEQNALTTLQAELSEIKLEKQAQQEAQSSAQKHAKGSKLVQSMQTHLHSLLMAKIDDLTGDLDSCRGQITALESCQSEGYDDLKRELESFQEQSVNEKKEIKQASKRERELFQEELATLMQQLDQQKAESKEQQAFLKKQLEESESEMDKRASVLKSQLENVKADQEQSIQKLASLQLELDQARSESGSKDDEMVQVSKQLNDNKSQGKSYRLALALMTHFVSLLQLKAQSLEVNLEKSVKDNKDLIEQLEAENAAKFEQLEAGKVAEIEQVQLEAEQFVEKSEQDLVKTQKELRLCVSLQNSVANLLHAKLRELEEQLAQVQTEKNAVPQEDVASNDEKSEISKRLAEVESDLAEKAQENFALQQEVDQVFDDLQEASTELIEVRGQLELRENQLQDANETISNLEQVVAEMSAKNVGSLADEEADIVEASNDDDEEAKEPGQDGAKKDSNLALIVELKAQIARLKSQASGEGGRNSWEGQTKQGGGRSSWGSAGQVNSVETEVDDQLKHVRNIMIQFLTKIPVTSKDNEDLLPVVLSMLRFSKDETTQINQARTKLLADQVQTDKKKGVLGFMKKK